MYNPFSLEGKTVLVTGASSGIGRGIAVECSKMGAKVVINGRNKERLQKTFDQLEGEGHIQIVADLSIQEDIERLANEVPELNGFVNSAGIPKICPVKRIDRQTLEEIMNVNAFGPILLTSQLLRKKKLQKKSSIVLIASISGVCMANTGEGPYAATKAALAGYTKTAAFELAGNRKIRPRTIDDESFCKGKHLAPIEMINSRSEFEQIALKLKIPGANRGARVFH